MNAAVMDMRFTDYLSATTRIIELGTSDGMIGQYVLDAGYDGYLGVVRDPETRSAIIAQYPQLDDHLTVAHAAKIVSQNNADVLVLNGRFMLHIARFRAIRHARFIAWRLRPSLTCVLAVGVAIVQRLIGRMSRPRFVWCDSSQLNRKRGAKPVAVARGQRAPFIVCRVREPRLHDHVRRFIPHALGVRGFFRCLQKHDVRYAVLRWFESLPHVAPGEDIDLLVDDADVETVRAVLEEGPGIQPVDVYSSGGLPGADFQNMPYFPPRLAEELLERAVSHNGICRVPAPREHFLSLAYHALYHKGRASGLPVRAGLPHVEHNADHNYQAALRDAAQRAGIQTAISLHDLDNLLDSFGWRPPHDMLVRLARHNRWIGALLRQQRRTARSDDRLAVFLVRDEALRRGGMERAVQLIEGRGFEIVAAERFDPLTSTAAARSIRGGNWGRGPWPISGGPPAAAIVAFDPAPISPNRRQRRRFPFVANARLLCKEELRAQFNAGLPADQHCNVIHSSDNGREALDYLRIVMPHRVDEFLALLRAQRLDRAA
jgi:hypothetical protein